jgi:tetratricopeptide (TPR) repeat protein
MTLADERLRELDDLTLTEERRAEVRCEVAADLAYAGQYEAAREALGELWQGIGERPDVRQLPPVVAAEVLLQCGVLTGWLGSVRNVAGAQERAKDLLSEALRVFKSQGKASKVSEAQYELGICYWRLGSHDEARVVMREAFEPLGDEDAELRAKILIRLTLVEVWENRYYEALRILEEAAPVFESTNDATKGRWHGQRGTVFLWLASKGRPEYADRAIIEFTAAIYHYERAGHERYCALNMNNLAFVLYRIGRYADAHEQLDRAQAIFTRLKDPGNLAQVDETRARVFVGERQYRDAERIIAEVIKTFERGGESALLADALVVQGVARARLGGYESSINILRQAMRVAQDAGAQANAGLAALTLIEEHGATRLPESELLRLYLRVDELLKDTQDVEDIARLRACARLVIKRLSGPRLRERNFSLHGAVHDLEARFIERALEDAEGSVSRAAKLLGLEHQSLIYLLNTRHKRLSVKRTPAKKRKQSIIRNTGKC